MKLNLYHDVDAEQLVETIKELRSQLQNEERELECLLREMMTEFHRHGPWTCDYVLYLASLVKCQEWLDMGTILFECLDKFSVQEWVKILDAVNKDESLEDCLCFSVDEDGLERLIKDPSIPRKLKPVLRKRLVNQKKSFVSNLQKDWKAGTNSR